MQVTLRLTNLSAAIIYRVLVITGAEEAGGATGGGVAYPPGTGQAWGVMPTQSGSLIVFGVGIVAAAWPAAANTPRPDNTFLDVNAVGNGQIIGYFSGVVTAGVTANVGHMAGGIWAGCGALELRRAGAAPPAIDPSTPPRVALPNNALVSTANFVPPPGSVLALIIPGGATAAPVITLTDTEGLAWTQRVAYNAAWQGMCYVYTASIPGAAGPPVQGWDGAAWRGGNLRGWSGSRWAPGRVWDGQQWRSLAG